MGLFVVQAVDSKNVKMPRKFLDRILDKSDFMVKLIPSTQYRSTKSRGEKDLLINFIMIKYDDWVVLHSQDMLERTKNGWVKLIIF